MVAMAIMAIMAAIGLPAMSGYLGLQQREAAKEISQTYSWLLDEAALRNVSFRIAYNLDRRSWKVEAGDPATLVFSTPEAREENDERIEDEMSRFTQREIEEGQAEEIDDTKGRFSGLDDPMFTQGNVLPDNTVFAYVFTNQYEEGGLTPNPDGPPDEEEDDRIAYTYIFPDGSAEYTLVRIVDEDDPEDGWSVEVMPISGDIKMVSEEIDPEESLEWIPEEGPELR